MLDKINEINFQENINFENLIPLFKSNNPSLELDLLSTIGKFKTYKDFFSNYSHFSLTFLENFIKESNDKINIFTDILTKNNCQNQNENELYITIITNIILLNYLFLKLNAYLNNIYTQLKDYIHITLKESKSNDLHYKLNEYLKIIEQSSDYLNRKESITLSRLSTKDETLSSNINASFRPQEYINLPSPNLNDIIYIDASYSPRSNSNDTPRPSERSIEISIPSNNVSPKSNEVGTPCFNKSGKNYMSPEQNRPKSRFAKVFFPQGKNNELTPVMNGSISTKNVISFSTLMNDNTTDLNSKISKEKPLVSLLAICNEMFKKKIIDFQEKCQLKKLIIGKDNEILNIFDKCEDKNILFIQIKEYLAKFF